MKINHVHFSQFSLFLYFTVLGETNEAFYQNIYSGQRLPVQSRPPRPPRPPLPVALRCLSTQQHPIQQQQQQFSNNHQNNNNINSSSSNSCNNNNYNEGPPWICNMCTFQNHPLLNKCEQCEMPQISSGTNNNSGNNNNNTASPNINPQPPQYYYQSNSPHSPHLQPYRIENMRFLNSAPPNTPNQFTPSPSMITTPLYYPNGVGGGLIGNPLSQSSSTSSLFDGNGVGSNNSNSGGGSVNTPVMTVPLNGGLYRTHRHTPSM